MTTKKKQIEKIFKQNKSDRRAMSTDRDRPPGGAGRAERISRNRNGRKYEEFLGNVGNS